MTEKEDIEGEMEKELNKLHKERVDDLAHTASILGSWMHDQKLTIAEQLTTVELLRSSILANYVQMQQMAGMARFIKEHPNTQVVMVNATEQPAPGKNRTFNPDKS